MLKKMLVFLALTMCSPLVLAHAAPTGTISINNGAAFVNSPTVTLNLSATDPSATVSSMLFTIEGVTQPVIPYSTTAKITMSKIEGFKKVSVQYASVYFRRVSLGWGRYKTESYLVWSPYYTTTTSLDV